MKNYQQIGMTLIEIMIALLIGAFLLGGVLQSFVGSKHTNQILEGLSRIQENGRFALDLLAEDIRKAGFWGCVGNIGLADPTRITIANTLSLPVPFVNNFTSPPLPAIDNSSGGLTGFDAIPNSGTWSPALPALIANSLPVGDSDIITIRRADNQGFRVSAHAANTDPLTLDTVSNTLGLPATNANLEAANFLNSGGANNCPMVIASNCTFAAIFQASVTAGGILNHPIGPTCKADNAGNGTADLGTTFSGTNAQVFAIHTISYFIRLNPDNQPSLYRRTDTGNSQELVEGIEQMQILYGQDTDLPTDPGFGSANYYVTADQVTDMNQVVSVRISLLVASPDEITSEPMANELNGQITDRRLRKVFTATIAIRNRQP